MQYLKTKFTLSQICYAQYFFTKLIYFDSLLVFIYVFLIECNCAFIEFSTISVSFTFLNIILLFEKFLL